MATTSSARSRSAPRTRQSCGFGDFTTTTFSGNTNLELVSARLDPSNLAWAQTQRLRGGIAVGVEVTSSDPAVGVITTSPVVFNGGDFQLATQFDPVGAGQATLTVVAPPGFETPSASLGATTQVVATVTAPTISVGVAPGASVLLGNHLQRSVQVTLQAAPPEPVDVTVTSEAPGRLPHWPLSTTSAKRFMPAPPFEPAS